MNKPNYKKTEFLTSAAKLTQLPKDEGIEVAFVGRSNSGKSSALNVLTGQKNLARTSKTPGRTQLINVFTLDDDRRLIDLPGYGYANVPDKVKKQWRELLDSYLRQRQCLKGIVLIMDSRHPLKEFDRLMLLFASHVNLYVHILLTKADKLSKNESNKTLHKIQKDITQFTGDISVQLFSAPKRAGLDELEKCLNGWFREM
jgi:GTP-binding protein